LPFYLGDNASRLTPEQLLQREKWFAAQPCNCKSGLPIVGRSLVGNNFAFYCKKCKPKGELQTAWTLEKQQQFLEEKEELLSLKEKQRLPERTGAKVEDQKMPDLSKNPIYRRRFKTPHPLERMTQFDIHRFYRLIEVWGHDDCWPAIRKTFWANGCNWPSYRVMMAVSGGLYDNNLVVCHSCDNSFCCNPQHLFMGTFADNAQDMSRKGRQWKQRLKNKYSSPIDNPSV
jgi:hypothetical protein